jgi:hypothetical protein
MAMQKGYINILLIGFFGLSITLRIASETTANASYLLIALYALLGRAQAIQALTLSWLFTMINPAFAPDASAGSIARYVVILAASVSVALRFKISGSTYPINSLSLLTFCLGVLMLFHSLLFSFVVDVSILKVVSWVMVVVTLLSAWQGLEAAQRAALFNQLQVGLVLLLVLSLPLLAVPDVGYFRNGTGFQGVLNHPQVFGPTVALIGALVGGRVMGDRKPAWRDIALLALCVVLVVLSEARTAGVAMVMGLLCSALLSPVFAGVSRIRMLPGLSSRRLQSIAVLAFAGLMVTGPTLSAVLSSYLYKRGDATSFIEAADASRGALIERMLTNIQEKPWAGIGFGIASEPESMVVERDAVLGLPVSALVEKGVMPIAVLEELGIWGALAVAGWFLVVLRRVARAGAQHFAVVTTLILTNFGESMFFSVGGMGMLLLVLLTGAATSEQRISRKLAHA